MSIRVIDDVLACEYGRKLANFCKKHGWQIDAIFALYYNLPKILRKHEIAENKKLNKQKEKQQKVFRKNFPNEVDEEFVIKTLQLTPLIFERRKRQNYLYSTMENSVANF